MEVLIVLDIEDRDNNNLEVYFNETEEEKIKL
jgi:hypothetical protein